MADNTTPSIGNETNGSERSSKRQKLDNKKKLILNAFVMNTPGHLSPGLWRHPRNKTDQYKKLSFWTDLAKLLDNAGFSAMVIADTLGPYDVYKGPANVVPALAAGAQFPVNDPLYLVPSMAAATKNLIFGVTASLTYEGPYSLARRLATVDHLSEGRFAWNIVTSYLDSAARNHGFGGKHAEVIFIGGQTPEGARATVDNIRRIAKEEGRDPDHIKVVVGINVIVAATDEDAKATREEYLSYADTEGALALFGGWTGVDLSSHADDDDFRFSDSPRVQSIVRRWSSTVPGTENLPWTKRRIVEYLSVGGLGAKVVGSPTTVTDELERWIDVADVDGFNLAHVVNPGTFEDIIEYLLPELERRGLHTSKVEKEGATAREVLFGTRRLPEDHPGSRYKWMAGEKVPKYALAEEESQVL